MSAAPLRVGMFGGAFDPPHLAHRALAEAALAQLGLDRLYVVPTGDAWHKSRALTPAADRLAMAKLAFAAMPRVVVDDRELRRSGPTYSIDTLRELQAGQPGALLHLLMGDDQAAGFTRWRDWEGVARMAVLCVAGRGRSEGAAALRALPGTRVATIAMPLRPESSTQIRARLTAGQDIADLVDPAVASYID
ncbi:MAG TPA: nicotinate (nicotinamide) nucleotide adenylyltransferase, partial [Ramlibacter sp.]|nr:nicotinate (nicotinamide) nucleotide adenylyltransferase [Ramlibacter sp.]